MISNGNGVEREMTAAERADFLTSIPVVAKAPRPSLTARQLRLGLVANGLGLDQVETAIAAIEDPQQRDVASIEWQHASQFEREHPLIAQVGTALGLTVEPIDAMWVIARKL